MSGFLQHCPPAPGRGRCAQTDIAKKRTRLFATALLSVCVRAHAIAAELRSCLRSRARPRHRCRCRSLHGQCGGVELLAPREHRTFKLLVRDLSMSPSVPQTVQDVSVSVGPALARPSSRRLGHLGCRWRLLRLGCSYVCPNICCVCMCVCVCVLCVHARLHFQMKPRGR